MPGPNGQGLAPRLSLAQFGSRRLDGGNLNESMQNSLELGDNASTPLSLSSATHSSAGPNSAWRKRGLTAHSSQTSASPYRFGQ